MVLLSPDGQFAILLLDSGKLQLVDTTSGKQWSVKLPDKAAFNRGEWAADGQSLVLHHFRGPVFRFDLKLREFQQIPLGALEEISYAGVSLSAGARYAATHQKSGRVDIWDLGAVSPNSITLEEQAVHPEVWFSNDGRLAATNSRSEVTIWNAKNGKKVTAVPCPATSIRRLVFAPDGRQFATLAGNEARVWNAETGEALTPPMAHSHSLHDLVFDPAREILLTMGSSIQYWDLRTGQPLSPALLSDDRSDNIVLPLGCTTRFLHYRGGLIEAWDFATAGSSRAGWEPATKACACHKIDKTGGMVPLSATEQRRILDALSRR